MKNIYGRIQSKKWYPYFMIVLSAILFDIGIQVFVQVAQILPSGLSALTFVPSFINPLFIPYIPLMYLGANIPLVIIF